MKTTKDDYRAALMQLVDVIAQMDPDDACLIHVSDDLDEAFGRSVRTAGA